MLSTVVSLKDKLHIISHAEVVIQILRHNYVSLYKYQLIHIHLQFLTQAYSFLTATFMSQLREVYWNTC